MLVNINTIEIETVGFDPKENTPAGHEPLTRTPESIIATPTAMASKFIRLLSVKASSW
jgi:hypothetical protein